MVFDARGERLRPAPLEVNGDSVESVAIGPGGKIAAGFRADAGDGVVVFDARGERLGRAAGGEEGLCYKRGHRA